MKKIFSLKRIYLLLLFPITALLVLLARLDNGWVEHFYFPFIYKPLAYVIGTLSSIFPFSVTEALTVLLPFAAGYIVYRCIKSRYPWQMILINTLCTAAVVLFSFELTMGLNYYRDTVTQKLGITVEKYSVDDLYELCEELVRDLNENRAELEENAAGVAVLSDKNRFETSNDARDAYRALSDEYTFLRAANIKNKPLISSRMFSYFLTTGIYIPFTFESNINTDVPEFTIPATMCHELTHYRGFMREGEANFLGYLACMRSERADFKYSAAFMAFGYAYPKLHDEDPQRAAELAKTLSRGVLTDVVADDAYWQQFYGTPAADISGEVYEDYLQSNGQSSGLKSYGEMVDLLIAYNKN